MKLKEVIASIDVIKVQGNTDIDISGIQIDSRLIEKGSMFIAVKGNVADGHSYINNAIEKGAVAVVCEHLPELIHDDVCYVCVNNAEQCTGLIATNFYADPTSFLELIGVTGTNGKTTIATLLYKLFRAMGYKVGLISTVCNYIDDKEIPTDHTTPDPITLNKLLRNMADEGCKYVFMEVSSHAVAQNRIGGLRFAGGIFTNLTRDHLDYHKTVENYLKAKKQFFDNLPKNAFALVNLDDKNGMVMVQNTRAKVATYSLKSLSDYKGKVLEHDFSGMQLDINGREVNVRFVGRFNASNLLAVFGAASMLGKRAEDILLIMSTLIPVNGRFDTLHSSKGYTAIVDYAHTPDAIDNVLNAIHDVLADKGNVITVVGAGGNRDKGKRPLMAQSAVKQSNKVVITSDNPRFEEPAAIIDDMLAGLTDMDRTKVLSIVDRKEAIRTACMMANSGDVILIAGKGHENYQDIKGVKYHFDDKEILKEIFDKE